MNQFLLYLILVVSSSGTFTNCDNVPDIVDIDESRERTEILDTDTSYSPILHNEAMDQDLQNLFRKRSKQGAPKFLLKCQSDFVQCKEKAGKNADLKLKCFPQFSKCFEENRPPLKPQSACAIKLHHCLRNSRDDRIERLYCYSGFCSCHLNNCPRLGLPSGCSTKKHKCLKNAGWNQAARKTCMNSFGRCIGKEL